MVVGWDQEEDRELELLNLDKLGRILSENLTFRNLCRVDSRLLLMGRLLWLLGRILSRIGTKPA